MVMKIFPMLLHNLMSTDTGYIIREEKMSAKKMLPEDEFVGKPVGHFLN